MKDEITYFIYAFFIVMWIIFVCRSVLDYYFFKKAGYEALLIIKIDEETNRRLKDGEEK